MTDVVFLNADRSAIVPPGSVDAAFGIQPKDMKRLGYDKLPLQGGVKLPDLPEPETTVEAFELRSASIVPEAAEPEAETKEAPEPANKAAKKPLNK